VSRGRLCVVSSLASATKHPFHYTFQEPGAFILRRTKRGLQLFFCRLLDKFPTLNEPGFLQSHRLRILQQSKCLAVRVQNENLTVEGAEGCGLKNEKNEGSVRSVEARMLVTKVRGSCDTHLVVFEGFNLDVALILLFVVGALLLQPIDEGIALVVFGPHRGFLFLD